MFANSQNFETRNQNFEKNVKFKKKIVVNDKVRGPIKKKVEYLKKM